MIESDYRKSLIDLLAKEKIINYDLTNIGKPDWFVDISHFSLKGNYKISNELVKIMEMNLEK